MRTRRFWLGLVFACWYWKTAAIVVAGTRAASPCVASGAPVAIMSPVTQGPGIAQPSTHQTEEEEEIEELEVEVSDRDPTYLRTRAIVRYDRRLFGGDTSSDRIRLRFLYGFGPLQRFAVSFLQPLVQANTPTETARGSGDTEVQFNANVLHHDRFRAGVGVQTTLQTASDALLGGTTTTLKPSVELAGVPATRLELVAPSITSDRSTPRAESLPTSSSRTSLSMPACSARRGSSNGIRFTTCCRDASHRRSNPA
jgi:hypothetical protein